MSQKLGEHELALRAMREGNAKRPSREAIEAALPKSGKKPVKRKKIKGDALRAVEELKT